MFRKLFDKIDELIDKFNELTNLDEIAIQILHLIEQVFTENFSEDMAENEKIFDEVMQQEGFWKTLGKKLKKAIKNKEEFLKQLLYIATIMAEFERRYRQKQKGLRKNKEIEKIIKKYTRYMKEAIENKNLDKETLEKTLKELRISMEKEIKSVSLELDR